MQTAPPEYLTTMTAEFSNRENDAATARKKARNAGIVPGKTHPKKPDEALFAQTGPDDNGQDVQVCQLVTSLIGTIVDFSDSIPAIEAKKTRAFMDSLLRKENRELVRYLGCLGIGGLKGEKGWEELLTEKESRRGLVVGILGMALKEKVFGDLWFGGTEAQREKLRELEIGAMAQDGECFWLSGIGRLWSTIILTTSVGFVRAKERAKVIKAFPKAQAGARDFDHAVEMITNDLTYMLCSFWAIKLEDARAFKTHVYCRVTDIVKAAGMLSRAMRSSADVIYYWLPPSKDAEFEPSDMECLNLAETIQASPYKRETINGMVRAVLKPGMEAKSEAIVRVVCFPGVVAYRQGGGALARRELAEEKEGDGHVPPDVRRARERVGEGPLTGHEGIRTKTICKSLVLLQWGKQRLLTKEAGTSAHIDAVRNGNTKKYDEDSAAMVDLYGMAEARWRPEHEVTQGLL
jgi:hypothetical protein